MEKLNEKSLETIKDIIRRHKDEPGPVIVMLHEVQDDLGYIPEEAMVLIAEACGVPVATVYGVVTFYARFTTKPKGKHVINVCLGTACYVKGSQTLLDRICEMTDTVVNGTSKDGIFSIDATRCLGACGLAPVCIIDGKVYGNANQSTDVEDVIQAIIRTERTTETVG